EGQSQKSPVERRCDGPLPITGPPRSTGRPLHATRAPALAPGGAARCRRTKTLLAVAPRIAPPPQPPPHPCAERNLHLAGHREASTVAGRTSPPRRRNHPMTATAETTFDEGGAPGRRLQRRGGIDFAVADLDLAEFGRKE